MGASNSSLMEDSVHDFTVKDNKGNDVDLSIYKGKVLVVVNVASKCGFTNVNYTQLSELYTKYKGQGLEILAFPCNQFLKQEPGSSEEAHQFACTRFKAEFPVFHKFCLYIGAVIRRCSPSYGYMCDGSKGFWNVNHLLHSSECNLACRRGCGVDDPPKVRVNGPTTAPIYKFLKASKSGCMGSRIKWNFTKFLVDKQGHVIRRYSPTTPPVAIEKDIQKALESS